MAVPDGTLPVLTYLGGLFSGVLLQVFGEKYREKAELDEHAFSVLRDELEGDSVERLLEPLSNRTIEDTREFFRPTWHDVDPHYRYLLDDELRDEFASFADLLATFYELEREKRDLETDRVPGDALYYGALREASPILISTTSRRELGDRLIERADESDWDNLDYAVAHWERDVDGDGWSGELWQYMTGEANPDDETHRNYWEKVREQRRTWRKIEHKLATLASEIERRHTMPTTRYILWRYWRTLVN